MSMACSGGCGTLHASERAQAGCKRQQPLSAPSPTQPSNNTRKDRKEVRAQHIREIWAVANIGFLRVNK